MIADDVSRRRKRANDVGLLPHKTSEYKKRRFHIMLSEHIQKPKSVGIIRSVIVGKRQFARTRRQSDERAAVRGHRRPHGLKPRPCRHSCQRKSSGNLRDHRD